MGNIVEMKEVSKSFVANEALKQVDFLLAKGSIHALLGENGAGKSTLMKVLGGRIKADSGKIIITGSDVTTNRKVLNEKVGFIHQELSLVNDLNIYENLFLGNEKKNGLLLNRKAMENTAREVLERMGVELNVNMGVSELNPSFKQIIEIARALLKNSEIIIMDEPTTALTDLEIARIFKIMDTLRHQGVSLIFISHKLNEVLEICDHYTVMRDGIVVATGAITPTTTENALSRLMLGTEVMFSDIYQSREIGKTILEIKDLAKEREFRNINMYVKQGEIVGVTGLMGDGRTELFASVCGANPGYSGQIKIDDRPVRMRNTRRAKRYKIAYVPKNRQENSIISDLSIEENLVLSIMTNLSKAGIIQEGAKNEVVGSYVKKLNIKVNHVKDLITSLSGGNQQKVVLSKALCLEPAIVVLDNPTQGVDVGAKGEIYRQLMELAKGGISFVILSNEIPELQKICDRVYVMFRGEIKQEFTRADLTEENIMLVATGGTYPPLLKEEL